MVQLSWSWLRFLFPIHWNLTFGGETVVVESLTKIYGCFCKFKDNCTKTLDIIMYHKGLGSNPCHKNAFRHAITNPSESNQWTGHILPRLPVKHGTWNGMEHGMEHGMDVKGLISPRPVLIGVGINWGGWSAYVGWKSHSFIRLWQFHSQWLKRLCHQKHSLLTLVHNVLHSTIATIVAERNLLNVQSCGARLQSGNPWTIHYLLK